MTALMVGAARTTEEKIHVHGLHYVSTSTLSDLQLRGLLCRARYDLDCSTPGSFERRDALINLENIRRVLAHAAARGPGRRGAEPRRSPALPKRSAGFARGCREESLRGL